MDGLMLGGRGMSQADVDARINAMRNHGETHSGAMLRRESWPVTL